MTNSLQKRIQQDEAELEALMKQMQPPEEQEEKAEEKEEEQEEVQTTEDTVVKTEEVETKTSDDGTDWKKRYSDLRSHMAKKEKEWKDEIEAIKADLKSTTAIPSEMPQTQKELQEWREKNPQAARILQALIEEEAEKKFEAAKIDLDEIKADRKRLAREKAEAKILEAHPDFKEITSSDEFHDWAEAQPPMVQKALYENPDDAGSVIKFLTLYKVENNIAPKAKIKKDSAADAVTIKGKTTADPEAGKPKQIRESWINSLSMRDYEKHEAMIEEAARSGNIIYDVTKKVAR